MTGSTNYQTSAEGSHYRYEGEFSPERFRAGVAKARSYFCETIVIPSNWNMSLGQVRNLLLEHKDEFKIIGELKSGGLGAGRELKSAIPHLRLRSVIHEPRDLQQVGLDTEILLEPRSSFAKSLSEIDFLREHPLPVSAHFPLANVTERYGWTPKEVYSELQLLRSRLGPEGLRTRPGLEAYNPAVQEYFCLEPITEPKWFSTLAHSNILISVVIPSFNGKAFLKNVVAHLLRQTLDRENFEIVVVDDGSTDGSEQEIYALLAPEINHVNLKYIYLPRSEAEIRPGGTRQYRAGIARNLGVKFCSGAVLQFLDADMIVSERFLETQLGLHETYDVIQNKRLHVRIKDSLRNVRFDQVRPEMTFIEEERYWGPFFKTEDWQSLDHHWKYACTYSFSLSKSLFQSCGRFSRNFTTYGFEDTELGYRLSRRPGIRFHLDRNSTYHLTPKRTFRPIATLFFFAIRF